MFRLPALLTALVALASPGAAGAAGWLDLWAEAGGGVDSNPFRLPGEAPAPTGFASLLGRARARVEGEGASAAITLTEAGRLYPDATGADALASRLEASGRAALGAGLTAALAGVASDARGRDGLLDRQALRGEGSLALRRGALEGRLAGGWSSFAPQEATLRPFRSRGPEGWLRLAWAPVEAQRVGVAVGTSQASFPGWAAASAPGSPRRSDLARHLAADWSWRGPALATLGWAFTQNRSSAPGGDFTRHRLTASAALGLPLEVTVAARLALQWSRYPDPLLLAAEQRLAEGQEALDQVEARFSRALGGALEASLSLAWYRARGGEGVPDYRRTVASLVLSVRE